MKWTRLGFRHIVARGSLIAVMITQVPNLPTFARPLAPIYVVSQVGFIVYPCLASLGAFLSPSSYLDFAGEVRIGILPSR